MYLLPYFVCMFQPEHDIRCPPLGVQPAESGEATANLGLWHRGRCSVNRVTQSLLQLRPPASSPSVSFQPLTCLVLLFLLHLCPCGSSFRKALPPKYPLRHKLLLSKTSSKHTQPPPKLTKKHFLLNPVDTGLPCSVVDSLHHRPGSFGSLSRLALQTDTSLYMVDLMGKTTPLLHLLSASRPASNPFTSYSCTRALALAVLFPPYLQPLTSTKGHRL